MAEDEGIGGDERVFFGWRGVDHRVLVAGLGDEPDAHLRGECAADAREK